MSQGVRKIKIQEGIKMVSSPVQEMKRKRLENEQQFQELRKDLIEKIQNLIQKEIFEEIKSRELLNETQINKIKVILSNLLSRINNEYTTLLSKWVLEVIKTKIENLEGILFVLNNSLNENKKDPSIKYIGIENKRTFKDYSDFIYINVLSIENAIEYLYTLYDGLKIQSQQVLIEENNNFLEKMDQARSDLVTEVENFRRLRNIADNAKTEDIYNNAVIKYGKAEKKYRYLFLGTLLIVILVSLKLWDTDYINNIINQPSYAKSAIFWSVKITTLIAGITLITYFLKQSVHYQRLAEQNYQTQLELQAYPSFMESIPTEEAASVRKELAIKYFGREIDGTAHKDMSNLISDQMKSTTDMVKATTEAIKNLNGTAK